MFDPLTVAFEIKSPLRRRCTFSGGWTRNTLVRVWHKDPCNDGTDSSCDHCYDFRKLNAQEKELSQYLYDAEIIFDNRPHYPDSREHLWFQQLKQLRWEWRKRRDPWRIHWRYHFWHYRIQVPILQQVWRFLFSRCVFCRKGFQWGEEVAGNWDGNKIWHFGCDHHQRRKQ